ncbi:MAG TPA: geranylgeranyl reductase family protein [Acidimicrobiales bacterium]|nr:geranylgeranyl reductase family protein [Acidimicrobiales bacterium]
MTGSPVATAVDTEVVVVGGGPAGAAAAITLARAGRDVTVVDKARFPRDKCCGDGLTAAALRELEGLGVTPDSVTGWQVVEEAWLRSPSGHTVCLPLPTDGQFAAVVPRADLDAAVLDAARAAGAKVHDGHGLRAARADGRGVVLDVDGLGSLRALYAIGADGAWSPLRHALGAHLPGYLGDWHAFRQYFTGVGPAAASGLWVWFEADLLPGYAWSFPLPGGRANVGFGIQRDAGIPVRDMKRLWPDLLGRPHVRQVLGDARPEGSHKAWPIPARVRQIRLTAAAGRALFAGDATAATDPLTGEGIAQALLTGRLAAEAVLAAGPARPVLAARRYEAEVGKALFADHRLAAFLSDVLSHRKGARAAIRLAGASAWTRRNFGRWLFEDYPRAVVATPARWRRGMFHGPGAYRAQR